jgi:hypothetical protein
MVEALRGPGDSLQKIEVSTIPSRAAAFLVERITADRTLRHQPIAGIPVQASAAHLVVIPRHGHLVDPQAIQLRVPSAAALVRSAEADSVVADRSVAVADLAADPLAVGTAADGDNTAWSKQGSHSR